MSAEAVSSRASGAGTRPRPAASGPAVWAGVAGALTIAFSAILVRLADVSPVTAAVFRCAYALPPLAVLALLERRRYGRRPPAQRALALGAGVFFIADLTFWHYSIAAVGAGLATVLGNLQVLFVALLAWLLLGERPAPRLFAAVPVVLVGVVLISGVIGAGAYGEAPALGVVFGILTGITYAGFILVLRQGNRDIRRPAGPLFDATLVATLVGIPAGMLIGDLDLEPSWPAHAWLLTLALTSQVLGWMLISTSLPRLPAALTGVLLTLQPVGSVLLGVALLGEAPSSFQLAGVVVIVAAIALATSGRRDRSAAVSP